MITLREVCKAEGVSRRAVQGYEKASLVTPTGRNQNLHFQEEQEMKKIYALILAMVMVVPLTACGEKTVTEENTPSEVEESVEEEIIVEEDTELVSEQNELQVEELDEFEEYVAADVEEVIDTLWAELDEMSAKIDPYEAYKDNVDMIETFYVETLEHTRLLCIQLREYSLNYAKEIMALDKLTDEKYDDMEMIYDCIYEDAGDDIYDEIYDGVPEEMYDIFYDGILDDAYDTVDYSEGADARSNEYEWWSDTRSDVYEEWSDFRSDVYEFWSDMRSELWSDDVERAEKAMADFEEDIAKLKGNDVSDVSVEADIEETKEVVEDTPEGESAAEGAEELVDGMRPEFKEAMDSYEAFEEWDEAEMNEAELKYYLDVNNRVMQNIVDVM